MIGGLASTGEASLEKSVSALSVMSKVGKGFLPHKGKTENGCRHTDKRAWQVPEHRQFFLPTFAYKKVYLTGHFGRA